MEILLTNTLFYLFSGLLIGASALVVSACNPVYSVLFLILAFFNAAALFVLLGAEFVAFILLIVYVGAVMVLFLFVVMMLDISLGSVRTKLRPYMPVGLSVAAVLLVELIFTLAVVHADPQAVPSGAGAGDNTRSLGLVLYTDMFYPFQMAGLILLVAMVGAIVLALRDRRGVRRQSVTAQNERRPEDVVKLRKVAPGEGAR